MNRTAFAAVYLLAGALGAAAIAWGYAHNRQMWVSVQNAKVWAPTYRVTAPQSGRLTSWTSAFAGSAVGKNDVFGHLRTARGDAAVSSTQGGTLVGDFGYRGELVQQGQELALVADLKQAYVLAYVTETRANSLRKGQLVDIYPATDPGTKLQGTVARIYPAVASLTWPLPAVSSGNYQKQAQWVPVRVDFVRSGGVQRYLGSSVTVRIAIGGGGA